MNKLLARIRDWQHWPFLVFYAPITYAWVWYYIRSRSFWFYTASNPTLAFGGFEGEGKSTMYRQLPEEFCPKSIFIDPSQPFEEVKKAVLERSLPYPFIVKPDIGMKGILFRRIETETQLRRYHEQMPARYIIQEFLNSRYEVGLFYYRMPDEKQGTISALLQKDLMELTGDGSSTLEQLIAAHPEARNFRDTAIQQGGDLQKILPAGERYYLSHVANLFHGARFTDLHKQIEPSLTALFDKISYQSHFYYGRYDIKCDSIEDLKQGKNFKILEFNGAGSVPNHIYAGRYNLWQAYKEILKHWKAMYEISARNKQKGISYWSFQKGRLFLKNSKSYFNRLKELDKKLVLT